MRAWEILATIAWGLLTFGLAAGWTLEVHPRSVRSAIGVGVLASVTVMCAWAAFVMGIRS